MKNDSLAILDEYDRAWSNSSQPDLAGYLRKLGVRNPAKDKLPENVGNLFAITLEKSWKHGTKAYRLVEEFFQQFPGAMAYDIHLIVAEFKIRHQIGDAPELVEYQKRFPKLWDRLKGPLSSVESSIAPVVVLTKDANTPGGMPPPPGFDRFEFLGQGGMGIVYRARETNLGRDVAVKILHPKFPVTSPMAKRFIKEARITGQLQHPGIPAIYSIGRWNKGRPYLIMKLIKGRTLDELMRNPVGRYNPLAVFESICQAVGYAHSRGVIHRDLKPANIMVGKFGEVQVMDWGLAKHLVAKDESSKSNPKVTSIHPLQSGNHGESGATQIGSVLGTPAYMSPEQAAGDAGQIDRRSDVFGLGAILCEILTGRAPYQGDSRESVLAMATRGDTREAFRTLDQSGRDPELIALCKQCLMAHADERPADGNAIVRAISRIRTKFETRIRDAQFEKVKRTSTIEARKKFKRRTGMQKAIFVLAILFGLAGSALGIWAVIELGLISRLGIPDKPSTPTTGQKRA